MTLPVFEASPVVLAAQFAAGAGVAVLFFRGLWWHTRLMVEGGRVSTLGALTLGRFALMGGLLTSAAFEGAGPLLASAFGVFIGRFFVLRSIGRGEP